MASNGNKGKFSDRLKRMKLFRYAKKFKLKVKGLSLVRYDVVEKKVINGAAVTIAFVGSGINKVIDAKEKGTVDNSKTNNNVISKAVDKSDVKKDYRQKSVDNDKIILDTEDEVVEKDEYSLKNKAISAASVGAAVIGAVGVNLLGGTSAKSDTLSSNNSYDKSVSGINNNSDSNTFNSFDLPKKEIDYGDQSSRSFKQVFKSGNDIILIDNIDDKDMANGDKKTYLAVQIMKKTKREFEKKLSEIEVLESELYVLNEKNENELDLEKCKEIKKEIERVLEKINHIVEQYNIYKYNQLLINTIDIDDHSLADDIIDFKKLYEGAEIQRRLASDYELVSKYQSLYDNLENIKTDFDVVWKKNENKVVDYEKRDKKYDDIKHTIGNIDKFNDDCNYYVDMQNKYIDDINSKVNKINVDEIVRYRFVGFGNLVGGTLRYLTMLFSRPFSSNLAGIAFQTYNANRMVNNLRRALRLEKITNTVYTVENMQYELDKRIESIDYNFDSVSDSISNVKSLKSEFMEQYNYDIPGYNDTLKKINDIENLLYNNQIKLNTIKNKLKINKKLNQNALHKCRILEKESKPFVERI